MPQGTFYASIDISNIPKAPFEKQESHFASSYAKGSNAEQLLTWHEKSL